MFLPTFLLTTHCAGDVEWWGQQLTRTAPTVAAAGVRRQYRRQANCAAIDRPTRNTVNITARLKRVVPRPCIINRLQRWRAIAGHSPAVQLLFKCYISPTTFNANTTISPAPSNTSNKGPTNLSPNAGLRMC